ncbi:MAG: tetratricopeptide repeat protein [Methyloceanibacter sp.]|uniref:tetratricopeptide repeat protein n=1 Tax=Methyloceanibacter sp. TaxID=1965321 RepID=UPI003D6D6BBF
MACFRANICLILVLAALATGAAGTRAEDQVLLRAREGAAAMIRGQFDRAVALYDEALATPDVSNFVQASIYSDRGIAKWRMKQTKEAIEDFNQSIQLAPESPTAYNNRGNVLMELGHPEEALKDFDRAIALSPSYGAAYINRGNAYAALHQYEAAFEAFRKAAELMPQSGLPFNGRGRTHTELERYHAAVRDLSRAISLDQRYAAAYRNRAEANFAIANYAAAAADATLALDLEPDVPQPNLVLLRARAYAAENKLREAIADFDTALELNPDLIDAYVERGILFANNRRFDDAIGDYNRAIEMDYKNARAYALRAEAKLNSDQPDEALLDVNQALALALGDPLALRIRASVYEKQERLEDAILDYQRALAKDPFQTESREALVRLGQEVPIATGQPLADPVDGWVITEPAPGRYIASNPDYGSLRAELEMFGAGKPRVLEWKLLRDALSGIGLLKYYAGNIGEGGDLEYVAIVDTRANKIVSIEPHAWGSQTAQWNWQAVSVVVTDPDGHANEVTLRQVRQRATPVARRDDGGFFGLGAQPQPRGESRRARRGGGGAPGGGGGVFDWLFR